MRMSQSTVCVCVFKQKTAYEMRISDWSSDVCSSDLFEELEVAEDSLLLPPQGLRRGFAALMSAYNAQRIGAATVALGIAQGAYEQALAYSGRREQFGPPICEFQGLHWLLADIATQLPQARPPHHTAPDCGKGCHDALESAPPTVHDPERAR